MQDELNQFKHLDVWELVECPVGRNIITVKWLWKNMTDAENTVHQSPRGIFINQSQYTLEILKKHGMEKCDSISIPMATARIDADLQGTPTDQTKYHSMIGGLMYLVETV
ncbi:retrovirus-related pol polyprotein from transposon TNT 1-94 [Tanacetum coccineum]